MATLLLLLYSSVGSFPFPPFYLRSDDEAQMARSLSHETLIVKTWNMKYILEITVTSITLKKNH